MNYAKIVKILPLLDSPIDGEALSALRILQRALLPETCGDIARLIEASLMVPEVVAPVSKPFNGFKAAAQRVKPPKPATGNWFWNEFTWTWIERVKPPKPAGEGWTWNEFTWEWRQVMKPYLTKYEIANWNSIYERWEITIDFDKVSAAAMEVMNNKLDRATKKLIEGIFLSAMNKSHISSSYLQRLEALERNYVNV